MPHDHRHRLHLTVDASICDTCMNHHRAMLLHILLQIFHHFPRGYFHPRVSWQPVTIIFPDRQLSNDTEHRMDAMRLIRALSKIPLPTQPGDDKDTMDTWMHLHLTARDLHAPGYQHLLGATNIPLQIACVSLHRLFDIGRMYTGHLPVSMLASREAAHELGHCAGLGHCPDIECVMHYMDSHGVLVLSVNGDLRRGFCPKCMRALLSREL